MHFVDQARIYVKAGDGGDGCSSFRREKFLPRGGPDGGDGGRGGDVIIRADPNLLTLLDLLSKAKYYGGDGKKGSSKNRTGADGADAVISVPVGTIVIDERTGLVLKDLTEPQSSVVVARGGRGGRGNARFATPTNQAPRRCEEGQKGQERYLRLELKLMADVGLLGRPNSGKSTLLSRISAAHPKIAPYPFTTLQPQLGIVDAGLYQRFVVAEVPGLIEGAHAGKGLGDEFLRHLERTLVLVHLVDAVPQGNTDPLEAYSKVKEELRLYSEALCSKPEIIVATKMDLPCAREGLKRLRSALGPHVLPVSAVTGQGLKELVNRILELLKQTRSARSAQQSAPPQL